MAGTSKSSIATVLTCLSCGLGAQAADPGELTSTAVALDRNAMIVLPIKILTSNARAPALAERVYDELMRQVASVEGLQVVDRDVALVYRGSDLSPEEIARQLGVARYLTSNITVGNNGMAFFLSVTLATVGSPRSHGSMTVIAPTDPTAAYSHLPNAGGDLERVPMDLAITRRVSGIVARLEEQLFPGVPEDPLQVAAEAEAGLLDPSLSDRDRVGALMRLSVADHDRHSSGLTEPAIVAAAQLGSSSADPQVRSQVWQILSAVDDVYLIDPLLYALANDAEEAVRKQAAEALRRFIDAPGVRDALDYAARNDPSEVVRRDARLWTLGEAEQLEMLRAEAIDTTLSDWRRSRALSGNLLHAKTPDHELLLAAIQLARTAKDARIRESVWFELYGIDDLSLVEPLLDALADDPNERVRRVAAARLQPFMEQPGVVEALEKALIQDESPLVRDRVENALAQGTGRRPSE